MLNSLKYLLNFEWLNHVGMTSAKSVFLALFVITGILILLIPSEYIYEGVEDRRWYHNLKLWALGDLVVIFVTYYIF
jgi:hypothetical protein